MKTYENNGAPNALDYLGNYLKKEDVVKPQVVRVIDVYEDELPGENRKKLIVKFADFGKPMVLNTTNIKRSLPASKSQSKTADLPSWASWNVSCTSSSRIREREAPHRPSHKNSMNFCATIRCGVSPTR